MKQRILMWSVVTLAMIICRAAVAEESFINDIIKNAPEFSAQELKTLEAQHPVYHPNASGLPGGYATIYCAAKPQDVWNTATDFEHYADFIPDTLSLKVLKRDEKTAVLDGEYKSRWPYRKVVMLTVNEFDSHDPDNLRFAWKALKTNMKQAT